MKSRPLSYSTIFILVTGLTFAVFMQRCRPDKEGPQYPAPTPLELSRPAFFPAMEIPADNPLTVEGVYLGRKLFYEKKLSGDNTLSCAGCHRQANAFAEPARFSKGIDQLEGNRNSMALFNLGYQKFYFWDGRARTLEEQILQPVVNPVEMHEKWKNAAEELSGDASYRELFGKAFGSEHIDSIRVAKAIAQFLRTMVSSNSRFDRYRRGEIQLTADEMAGLDLFMKEGGEPDAGGSGGADCFHCHGFGDMQFTDHQMRNNGLDSEFSDQGLGGVTGRPQDMGKFKVTSIRNLSYTAPYMHDGRFVTLEEVVEHYNSGGKSSPTIDPAMKHGSGGLMLSDDAKRQLIAFLRCLDDPDFIANPAFGPP